MNSNIDTLSLNRHTYLIPFAFLAIAEIWLIHSTPPTPTHYVYDSSPVSNGIIYLIKNYPVDNSIETGFACKCENSGGTLTWKGLNDINCMASPYNADKAILLNHTSIHDHKRSSALPPTAACCQDKPKVNNIVVASLPNCP